MGLCHDPCEFAKVCAPSAKCTAKSHRPICSCPEGHEGNPMVKCVSTDKSSKQLNQINQQFHFIKFNITKQNCWKCLLSGF